MKKTSGGCSEQDSFLPYLSNMLGGLRRREVIFFSYSILFLNAILFKVANGVVVSGFLYSITNTFGVSSLVWFGAFMALNYSWEIEDRPISSVDRVVLALSVIVSFLPIGPITWVALSLVSTYFILNSNSGSKEYRASWIMLSITVPMFWSRQIFSLFSDFFLSIDASLVAHMTGTQRISNLVAMPSGDGYLQIAAPCSSMANVSLAILCWSLFTQMRNLRWRPGNVFWAGLACLLVVSVNVVRITLIGYYPQHYELLHGPVGSTVAGWLSLLVVVCVCYIGVNGAKK